MIDQTPLEYFKHKKPHKNLQRRHSHWKIYDQWKKEKKLSNGNPHENHVKKIFGKRKNKTFYVSLEIHQAKRALSKIKEIIVEKYLIKKIICSNLTK